MEDAVQASARREPGAEPRCRSEPARGTRITLEILSYRACRGHSRLASIGADGTRPDSVNLRLRRSRDAGSEILFA